MRRCGYCQKSIVRKNSHAIYCSDHCRNYARRLKLRTPIPARMINSDRWIRFSPTKKPLRVNGQAASSTDSSTWSTYKAAAASRAGIGLGYVLGQGIGCIDLDHCIKGGVLDDEAEYFIANYPGNYIEISPSGDGLHIWGLSDEQPGTRRTFNALSIERYSVGRYITITGNVHQNGELQPL